ncbi:uncharacterized protein LOC121857931 [Homarus americanus]|uniref:uncharacterized protein LOC121857379 n=1 Tax=Homarus americanus TaxID=6706 RepID=UPI001C48419C|nr:uncharacterized protein LOC121857379 [Homarus americanus]XP_042210111.1 uncharacterized protein LOC121857931 [Homarus americanus]
MSSSHCMVVQKGSPIISLINRRLRSLVEFGLYEHWLFSTLRHSRICRFAPSKITVRTSLAFSNLWGMFVLLGAGLQLATLVFCLEVVVGRRKSSPRTHTLSSKL